MAKRLIPGIGEPSGTFPWPLKIKKVRIAAAAAAGVDVVVASQATFAIFNVPAGALVVDFFTVVNVAFTASVTLNIGDATTTNGWMPTASVAPQTAVTTGLLVRATLVPSTYAPGKLYAAATDISVVVAGATPLAGQLDAYIVYLENAGLVSN